MSLLSPERDSGCAEFLGDIIYLYLPMGSEILRLGFELDLPMVDAH